MSDGKKILDGLKDAIAGGFSSVTIDGQRWVRQEPTTYDHPYNDGYTHEALHTASVLLDTWDRHVCDARCADEFPDVKEAAQKAIDAMHDVYQLIGSKFRQEP